MLELLVALAIMALLSGVVMVSLAPALEEARLRAGAGTVIAVLRYARSYAVTYRTQAAVVFDTENSGVSVEAMVRDEDGAEAWLPVTTQAGRLRKLADGVLIDEITHPDTTASANSTTTDDSAANNRMTFSLLGQGEDVRITLRDARGHVRVIAVDAVTGHCRLVSDDS